jgi:hypothetical protein
MQVKNACTAQQITDALTACFSATATMTTCQTFASANATCLECIAPQTDAGVELSTGAFVPVPNTMFVTANVAGCIAILDPTNGPTCAPAWQSVALCSLEACSSSACQSASQAANGQCQQAASTGACSMENSSLMTDCAADFADGGAGTTCTGFTTINQIINVICGTGM